MEKIRLIPLKKPSEYTSLDDRPLGLNSVMLTFIQETAYQKAYIPNTSLTSLYSDKRSCLYLGHDDSKTDITTSGRMFQQNMWNSRVFRNGVRDHRWFDKLQDYRNGV